MLAQRIKFRLEMILKCGHILRRLTTSKAHERVFETQLVFLWREVCCHLDTDELKDQRKLHTIKKTHLCKLMLIITPGAYISEREKELCAWTKRVVMSFSLERGTDQIGRDDVQMKVSVMLCYLKGGVFDERKEGGRGSLLH